MLKGVIFDCDGVIVDSESEFLLNLAEYLRKCDIIVKSEEIQNVIGKNITDIFRELRVRFNIEAQAEELVLEFRDSQKKQKIPKIIKGVKDLMENLNNEGIKIAIASSSPLNYLNRIVNYYGLNNYVDIIISGDSCKKGKPDPEIYVKTVNKLRISKSQCIVIEDSVNGIQAGVSAGIKVIGFKGASVNQNTEKASIQISNFNELSLELMEDILKY